MTTLPATRQKVLGFVLIAFLIGNGATLLWIFSKGGRIDTKRSALGVYGGAPDFSLTERSGQTFVKESLVGKPWIADFIFTRCSGQCPMMSAHMQRIQGLFPKETDLHLVSFTVDPNWDSPEVLSRYAERYSAEKDRWLFLTGPKEEINRILKGFFLSSVDEDPNMHSIRFILVDGEGQIRGFYDAGDPSSIKQLIQDTKVLISKR
ncbi:MAG: SCO family protein [Candidatus Omnitrophica bacterium]|nr:SCO family protein [Candidatus Omnitrophota bacterium]